MKEKIKEYFTDHYGSVIDYEEAFSEANPQDYLSEDDYNVWKSLPSIVTVYRGCDYEEVEELGCPQGISYTLDKKIAEFFAYRYNNEDGCVIEATVPKDAIKCYYNGRNEREVIIIDFPYCYKTSKIISQGEVEKFDIDEFNKEYKKACFFQEKM